MVHLHKIVVNKQNIFVFSRKYVKNLIKLLLKVNLKNAIEEY